MVRSYTIHNIWWSLRAVSWKSFVSQDFSKIEVVSEQNNALVLVRCFGATHTHSENKQGNLQQLDLVNTLYGQFSFWYPHP